VEGLGNSQDADGYTAWLDGSAQRTLSYGQSVRYESLRPGDHVVRVADVAPHCKASRDSVTERVRAGTTDTLQIEMTCLGGVAYHEYVSDGWYDIVYLNEQGRRIHLATEPGMKFIAAWSPDGDRLLYEHVDGNGGSHLYSVRSDGTDRRELTSGSGTEHRPRWSPDGSRVAVTVARTGGSDLWLIDARTKAMSRLTTAEGSDDPAEWTPDGRRVIYRSVSPAGMALKWVALDGSERPTVFLNTKLDPFSVSMSHDGKWAVIRTTDLTAKFRDIFVVPLTESDSTPRPFVATAGTENCPTFSPDDRWMAYASDENGRVEVYVRPFPGPGERIQISTAGGTEPRWSRDGRTLFYRVGRWLYAATVTTTPAFAVTDRRPRFEGTFVLDAGHTNYDPAPDGKHFLMLQSVDRQAETIMVYGWANELRRRWR
jgi:serine/threonine-protein kinase